jgi:hypothetical protein
VFADTFSTKLKPATLAKEKLTGDVPLNCIMLVMLVLIVISNL